MMPNWFTTFARFPPGKIPVLDRLSDAHPAVLAAVYIPVSGWFLWQGWSLGPWATVAGYALGLLIWSVLEYVVHRVPFHHAPTSRLQVAHGSLTYDLVHYFIHGGFTPTWLGRFLGQYHLTHHYAAPDRHFGVSSPPWDVVFRTR